MPIAQQLDSALTAAIGAGGTEVEIVKRYVQGLGGLQVSGQASIRTDFIHQRPYVFFVSPSRLAGRQKCELGDILYVTKHLDPAGLVLDHRCCFVQAKKGVTAWHIEGHQLEFLSDVRRIRFKFGNIVYACGGVAPRVFDGLEQGPRISQYLLLRPQDALCYATERVKARQQFNQTGFSISSGNPVACASGGTPLCSTHDSHLVFLQRMLAGRRGARISGDLQDVVELVYKRIGWQLDPPEEFGDYFVEDGGGLAVVEVTVHHRSSNESQQEPLVDWD